ncbi:DUF3581 family protein [Marinobacter confluentis]|uniref:DUF3581 family protein n=1 Tax=Marinobacter confluentis TaxID=1697557 RepID=A0A4Z1C4J1_9GAMM|nr:DUF3581 family protein [Marinobacter confluentis]TGN40180.1 DUF3581 family protein [Marinobacter confluentis]
MFLERYHSIQDGKLLISAQQGSRFAKEVAGDFNPIHNPDARRFCVPGDLLFALLVAHFGLSRQMTFHFRSLLGDCVPLTFREDDDGVIRVCDDRDKVYIEVEREGESTRDPDIIEHLVRSYVAESGKNFPHTIKPLMEKQGVMFNPDRPMIMYQSMSLTMETLDAPEPQLELGHAELVPDGKRGNVALDYRLMSRGREAGLVSKKLVVSGLREYDAQAMDAVVEQFYRLKEKAWD